MAFSARAPRSHCAWKPENAEQHLSLPQCQVSVGKKTPLTWNEQDLNQWVREWEKTRPLAFSIIHRFALLVTSVLGWQADAFLFKKNPHFLDLFMWKKYIIFTLNNKSRTCMILMLARPDASRIQMVLRAPILTRCSSNSSYWQKNTHAINYLVITWAAPHSRRLREDEKELNIAEKQASLTCMTWNLERPINQAASSATNLSTY